VCVCVRAFVHVRVCDPFPLSLPSLFLFVCVDVCACVYLCVWVLFLCALPLSPGFLNVRELNDVCSMCA
jgi:hypothetical protein